MGLFKKNNIKIVGVYFASGIMGVGTCRAESTFQVFSSRLVNHKLYYCPSLLILYESATDY